MKKEWNAGTKKRFDEGKETKLWEHPMVKLKKKKGKDYWEF